MAHYPGPSKVTTTVLGVDLVWPNPGSDWRQPIHQGMKDVHEAILVHAASAIRRQKRDQILYWDTMTALETGDLIPKHLIKTKECGLAADLVLAIGDDQLSDEPLLELGAFKPIANAGSKIDLLTSDDSSNSVHANSRIRPDRITFDLHGRPKIQKPGPFRRLFLEMDDLRGDAASIDWYRALLLALLVQLRCDVEVYLDTGFMRIRRCQRRACGAFFQVGRMAGRQRFCSATCRACAPREQRR